MRLLFWEVKLLYVRLVTKQRQPSLVNYMPTTRQWEIHNLVPRVLSNPPYGARERETLENAGHVAPEQN